MPFAYLLFVLLTCVIAMLFVRRQDVSVPFACAILFLPSQLKVVAGSVNIWGTDILCILALLIVLFRSEGSLKLLWWDALPALPGLWFGLGLLVAHGENLSDSIQATIRWAGPWIFPYLIARIGISSWCAVKRAFSSIVFAASFISLLAVLEALTGKNPLVLLGVIPAYDYELKFGFYRPKATFTSLHIMGMFLAIAAVYSLSMLTSQKALQPKWIGHFLICSVGTYFSTSATGILQGVIGLLILAYYPLRKYWHVPVVLFVAWSVFVHFVSNRSVFHWYAGRMLGMGAAYYRADLMVYLPKMMPGHWLFGYGFEHVMPMWYAHYQDICNQWLFNLAKGGLPCLLFLVLFYILMFYRLRRCYLALLCYSGERVFVWAIMSLQISIAFAFFFIALYGSDIAIFSYIFGVFVSLPVSAQNSKLQLFRKRPVTPTFQNKIVSRS